METSEILLGCGIIGHKSGRSSPRYYNIVVMEVAVPLIQLINTKDTE